MPDAAELLPPETIVKWMERYSYPAIEEPPSPKIVTDLIRHIFALEKQLMDCCAVNDHPAQEADRG